MLRTIVVVGILSTLLLVGVNAIRRSDDETDVAPPDSFDHNELDHGEYVPPSTGASGEPLPGGGQSNPKDPNEPEPPKQSMAGAFVPVIAILFASKMIPALDAGGSSMPMLVSVMLIPRVIPFIKAQLGNIEMDANTELLFLAAVSIAQFAMIVYVGKSMGYFRPEGEKSLGKPAGDVKAYKYLQGTPVDVQRAGSVKVVELWASWCAPCKTAIPHLNQVWKKLVAEFGDNKVQFVGLSNETEEVVTEFVKNMGDDMKYSVAIGDYKTDYPASGIPCAYVVDKDGIVTWVGHPKDVEAAIRDALAEGDDVATPKIQTKTQTTTAAAKPSTTKKTAKKSVTQID